jgi:sterol desaturase/sphingolipid hydroxylase (fatty acid hydroxylase superfamily)
MDETVQFLLQFKIYAVGAWLVLLFALERWRPRARPPSDPSVDPGRWGWRRLVRNGLLWGINSGLSPLVVIPITAFATTIAIDWRAGLTMPAWWSFWHWLAIDILILDLFIYGWHRLVHTVPLLWRFHEVHHLDETLDTTSAVRFHFGEVLLSALARGVVVILADIPLASVLVFETFVLIASLFHHSNVRVPGWLERPLSRVIITPSIHWVHHHAVRRDTDSNYGTIFSFWDRLFASLSPTKRTPTMKIGVEKRHERPVVRLLARPLDPP